MRYKLALVVLLLLVSIAGFARLSSPHLASDHLDGTKHLSFHFDDTRWTSLVIQTVPHRSAPKTVVRQTSLDRVRFAAHLIIGQDEDWSPAGFSKEKMGWNSVQFKGVSSDPHSSFWLDPLKVYGSTLQVYCYDRQRLFTRYLSEQNSSELKEALGVWISSESLFFEALPNQNWPITVVPMKA